MSFHRMLNQVMVSVTASDREMVFESESGDVFTFCHLQDCCENVYIEDISGDLEDLIGSPLFMAEEVSEDAPECDEANSHGCDKWYFYKFATGKGYVTVRWFGTSNGYYSTSVDFLETKK